MTKRLKKIAVNGFISYLSRPGSCIAPEYRGHDSVRMDCEIGGCQFEVKFVIADANLDPAELFAALMESLGVNIDVEATFQPKAINSKAGA